MPRNSFIRMTKLHNVRGRITYITSRARQENLYAVYETTDRSFWTQLAGCNQEEFKKSGTKGKCIEARELIIALPETFVDYDPDRLLKVFTDHFKDRYGTDCAAALHHNKRKTNYHIHLVFSERSLLDCPAEKIATRNMFYDEHGNHVRTKKEILDEQGNIRKGCKVIKKGEAYERQIFTVKDSRFKSEGFLDKAKRDYTDLINQFVRDGKQRLQVFERGGMYLATKKIGKNNPKEEKIKADNEQRLMWNQAVDRAVVTGIAKEDILLIKKEQITDKVSESVKSTGNRPDKFSSIISAAIAILELLISKMLCKAMEVSGKVQPKVPENAKVRFPDMKVGSTKPQAQEAPKPQTLREAASYHRLRMIDKELTSQNNAIFTLENKSSGLKTELSGCKGFFKAARRSELSAEIAELEQQIAGMKVRMSKIATENGFKNVEAFNKAFRKAEADYKESQHSLHDNLQNKEQGAKERQVEKITGQSKQYEIQKTKKVNCKDL